MSFLLDTNVLSELLRATPHPSVLEWLTRQNPEDLCVSAVTQAEILLGAKLLPAGRRRETLEQGLESMFAEDFAQRVLSFDRFAAEAFAEIVASRRAKGRPISQFDAQIAAIAVVHGCTIVTRNVKDFVSANVPLLDPWHLAH